MCFPISEANTNSCFLCGNIRRKKKPNYKEEKESKEIVSSELVEFLQIDAENLTNFGIIAHNACQKKQSFMAALNPGKRRRAGVHVIFEGNEFDTFLFCVVL